MPKFSKKSHEKLRTCHPDLQRLFNEVIKHYDCTILEGHRGEELQNLYYEQGKSKVRFPDGRHNQIPSMAIDVAPYPVDWSSKYANMYRFYHFGGYVMGVAKSLGIELRWGGDWDGDNDFSDQNFNDLPHFELIKK